jgi:hypothetical protein
MLEQKRKVHDLIIAIIIIELVTCREAAVGDGRSRNAHTHAICVYVCITFPSCVNLTNTKDYAMRTLYDAHHWTVSRHSAPDANTLIPTLARFERAR